MSIALFFLCSLLTKGLAGIQPVEILGIENVSIHLVFMFFSICYTCTFWGLIVFFLFGSWRYICFIFRLMLQSLLMAILHTFGRQSNFWNSLKSTVIILFSPVLLQEPNSAILSLYVRPNVSCSRLIACALQIFVM